MTNPNKTSIIAETEKQELFIIREFDHPREKVFRAFTDPAILVKFFAPPGVKMTFEVSDYRTGGAYRYIQHLPDGHQLTAFGFIHELKSPERVIQTFEFADLPEPGHVVLETMVFESLSDRKTKLTIHDVCRSVEDRDAMIESGMESGLVAVFDQLDELLKKESEK